ncbi:hypothetical protein PspLS_03046 [Pyricularia sp. CBS 133598]|nr:hypothetical protein PspLS_03046 [Pyricularia sp. CBS 133598]
MKQSKARGLTVLQKRSGRRSMKSRAQRMVANRTVWSGMRGWLPPSSSGTPFVLMRMAELAASTISYTVTRSATSSRKRNHLRTASSSLSLSSDALSPDTAVHPLFSLSRCRSLTRRMADLLGIGVARRALSSLHSCGTGVAAGWGSALSAGG